MEKIFDQWALEGSKVTPYLKKKMKILAHFCAQTLSLPKFFISCSVSLDPNLEYTNNLRSVSHQLKGWARHPVLSKTLLQGLFPVYKTLSCHPV